VDAGRAHGHAGGGGHVDRQLDDGVDITVTERVAKRLELPAEALRDPAGGLPAGGAALVERAPEPFLRER